MLRYATTATTILKNDLNLIFNLSKPPVKGFGRFTPKQGSPNSTTSNAKPKTNNNGINDKKGANTDAKKDGMKFDSKGNSGGAKGGKKPPIPPPKEETSYWTPLALIAGKFWGKQGEEQIDAT